MRRTQEKFLEAMQERAPSRQRHRLMEKAQFNGLDQKLYEKDDRVHQGTWKTSYDREDYVEDQETSLKTKKNSWNQLKETPKRKRTEPEKDRLEKDEDGTIFDGT